MIGRYTHVLENRITSCHASHAFSHSPNRFMFSKHCFCFKGVPGNNLATIRNCPGSAR